jgi:hypothetical protein
MVTHAFDANVFPADEPNNDIAEQVLAKLQSENVGQAYTFLKSSVQNVFSGRDEDYDGVVDKRDVKTDAPMNSKEKDAFWNSLVKELEEKQPGVMQRLSGVWLRDYKTRNSKDAPLNADWVESTAQHGQNLDKTFAGLAAKEIDIIARLNRHATANDGYDFIDDTEISRNIKRQNQESREEFVKKTVETAIKEAATDPVAATTNLYSSLRSRGSTESQEEENLTHKLVADALKEHPDVVKRLATGYVSVNFTDIDRSNSDLIPDKNITMDEVARFNPESVGVLFMSYIKANFAAIADTSQTDTVHDGNTRLTKDEVVNHINLLNRDSRKAGK